MSAAADALCRQLAQSLLTASACSPAQHASITLQCKELAAAGAFRRPAFLSGLAQQCAAATPLRLVQVANSLVAAGLFGLQLLQELLPSAQQAAGIIQAAAGSQDVCLALTASSGSWCALAHDVGAAQPLADAAPVLQLLQALLTFAFDAAVVGNDSTAAPSFHMAGAAGQGAPLGDTALQQYVTAVLQQLQEDASQHQALAVCLVQAAASCGLLCDSSSVASWARQQLQRQLQGACQAGSLTTAAAMPAATPPAAVTSARGPLSSWACLVLQPLCLTLLVPPALRCLPLPDVTRLLQDHMAAAAGSVTGVAGMCELMAALDSCGHQAGLVQMLSRSLSATLACGDMRSTLAALLLSEHMVAGGSWDKGQCLAVLQQAGSLCMEGHAAAVLPVLLKAFNLLLPMATTATLQAQVEYLQQLRPQLGPVLQDEAAKAAGVLKDVLAQQQHAVQEQQNKQGGKVVGRAAFEVYNTYLDQYLQLAPDAQGRRLTQLHVARWRLMGAAATFCEAFTQQPPDSLPRTQACMAYIQELQAHKLCTPEQAEAFRTSCLVCGLDPSAQQGRPQQRLPAAEAGPKAALKGMLDRLPAVVEAGSRPGLAVLLARITQTTQDLLQLGLGPQQQQQQQQQQLCAGLAQPAAKKQRTAGPSGPGADGREVLDLLLAAYAAASTGLCAGSDWRVEFLRVLQQLPGLHEPLLHRLLGSLRGTAWEVQVAPQQALWHGSLLAWLSASQLTQLPFLGPTAEAAVSAATVAAPLFSWHCGSASSSSRGGDAACHPSSAAGQVKGCQLVQQLVGCTSVGTPHARCSAASFWAGYVGCIKTSMQQWCAGPHGPFGSPSSSGISPGPLTAVTQQPAEPSAAAQAQQQQQQLVAYLPPQLALLLRQLVAELTSDVQQAAGSAGAGPVAAVPGGVSYDVVASALQVCTRALKVQAVKWVCQLYEV